MTQQVVMDATGHSTHVFDKSNPVDVADALARFDDLTRKGFRQAKTTSPGNHEISNEFDPSVDVIFVPPMAGG